MSNIKVDTPRKERDYSWVPIALAALLLPVVVVGVKCAEDSAAEARAACSVWQADFAVCELERPSDHPCRADLRATRPVKCGVPRLPIHDKVDGAWVSK